MLMSEGGNNLLMLLRKSLIRELGVQSRSLKRIYSKLKFLLLMKLKKLKTLLILKEALFKLKDQWDLKQTALIWGILKVNLKKIEERVWYLSQFLKKKEKAKCLKYQESSIKK